MSYKNYLNVYDFSCELPGTGEVVKYKPLTTGQIKKLLVHEKETNPIVLENVFDQLITSSVISEDFDIDKIYVQDKIFLLIEIRKHSKGEQFTFQFTCPKCKSQNLNYFDFNKLEVIKKQNTEYGEVTAGDNIKLYIDFITRGEQKESYNMIENIEELTDSQIRAEMSLHSLASGIKKVESPDGIEEIGVEDKLYIVNSLTVDDLEEIRKWYDNNNFGIDIKYKLICDNCGFFEEKTDVEVSSNFF